jgi:hypothetical protein
MLKYPGVPGLNLGSETGILTEIFRVIPQSLERRDSAVKSGHDRFLPHLFQFVIRLSPFHSTLYSFSY